MTTRRVAIHQSQYIPWPSYFRKMASADIFVILDKVQFQKNGVQNRNKIRNSRGDFWLTIPVTGHLGDLISDKKISDSGWGRKHLKSLEISYANAPMWGGYSADLKGLYSRDYSSLGDVNESFLGFLINRLAIKTKIVKLSDLNVKGAKSDLILESCKILGADEYVSGPGGKGYLREEIFLKEGITVTYLESISPRYRQFHGDFIPDLSILDMMLNLDVPEIAKYLEA